MKIAASHLFNTSFSNLRINLGDAGGRVMDNADKKRLHDLQEALNRLRVITNPKQMIKQASAEKIGMLQRRLMELKQMLLHASPQQAKALAREIKSIAGELSSAAKAASAASRGSQATPIASPVVAGNLDGMTDASAMAASNEAAGTEADETAANQAVEASREGKNNTPGENRSDTASDSIGFSDKVLNDMLKEARKLLKEVIEAAKRKMAHGDKESRQNLEGAEKKLREIGLDTETQIASVSLYNSQGAGAAGAGGVDVPAATGGNISVEA